MNVAFGLKAHSGWAALVVLGGSRNELVVIDRRRVELVEESWAKQPYHAAEELEPKEAHGLVKRGIDAARRIALQQMRELVKREQKRQNELVGCAVLVNDPMPDWSTAEILAVHFRMHKAEGVLFRDVLVRATEKCGLRYVAVHEKRLAEQAGKALRTPATVLTKTIATLGKSVGPPWGRDQKDAALAALIALRTHP
jgi:hypothetical protein